MTISDVSNLSAYGGMLRKCKTVLLLKELYFNIEINQFWKICEKLKVQKLNISEDYLGNLLNDIEEI